MKYVLVIMMFAYNFGNGNSPAITTHEFDSRQACEIAAKDLKEKIFLGWSQSDSPYIDARCYEK